MTWTVNLSNSQLNNLVSSSIADGSYSYQEALNLLSTVAVGGITLSEWNDLKTVYTNSASLFASDYVKAITYNVIYENLANGYWWGGAATQLEVEALGNMSATTTEKNAGRLIDKWFLGLDLPMPIVGGDTAKGLVSAATYDYAFAAGQLFVSGAAASDVNQGAAGTCYLVASLGSIANINPSIVNNSFIDNGNGTYGIKFYLNGSAAYTTINKEVAIDIYNRIALSGNANYDLGGELWVSLLEKAYAQLNAQSNLGPHVNAWNGENSYQAIEGGFAAPIKQITGLNYKYYSSYYNGKFDAFSSGEYYSSSANTYKQSIIDSLKGGSIGWLGSFGYTSGANGKTNFVDGHAFMLLGYNSATDKFIIRNPWGGDGSKYWNPQFEASIEEFWNPTVKGIVALTDTALADPVYNYTIASSAADAASAVTEGGSVTFTITRSGSGTASTVFLSTTPGSADASDYQALTKSALSFAANETAKTVTVKTLADSLTEGVENFKLDLFKASSDTTGAAIATAYVKDAAVQDFSYAISSSAATVGTAVVEGGKVTFTITRSGSGIASTVYLSATPGTAGATDFQSSNKVALSFAAYETKKTVSIDTYEDVSTEGIENFSLDLYKNPGDATKTATSLAYIKDKLLPTYEYTITSNAGSPAAAVAEGGKVLFTITRSRSGTESTVFVSTAGGTAGGADFVGIGTQAVTFSANQTSATLEVQTNEDWWLESIEYFTLNL